MSESLKIAEALETLVEKAIRDFEFALNVLKVPNKVRVPMWDAMSRRATAKALVCEEDKS